MKLYELATVFIFGAWLLLAAVVGYFTSDKVHDFIYDSVHEQMTTDQNRASFFTLNVYEENGLRYNYSVNGFWGPWQNAHPDCQTLVPVDRVPAGNGQIYGRCVHIYQYTNVPYFQAMTLYQRCMELMKGDLGGESADCTMQRQ